MQISLFGGRHVRLPDNWSSESSFSLIGGSHVDATAIPAGGSGTIRLLSLVGGADVTVPAGSRVRLKGGGLVSGRRLDVTPGDGPEITVLACSVVGGVHVHDART